MNDGLIRLRFVTGNDLASLMIREACDFWASHVEAALPGGAGYLGAHLDGGVQIKPVGYDKGCATRELIVDLPCDGAVAAKFYARLAQHLGEPYDVAAILGFLTRTDLHSKSHAICSALQAAELEASGFFARPLAKPPWQISPPDLLLVLSGIVPIGDVTPPTAIAAAA